MTENTFGNVTEVATSTTKVTSKTEKTSYSSYNAISLTTKIQEETTTSTTTMTSPVTTLEGSSTTITVTVRNKTDSHDSAVHGKYYYFIIFKSYQSLLYLHVTYTTEKNIFILKAEMFLSML